MTTDERMDRAVEHALVARKNINRAFEEPDPVFQRRLLVKAAKEFRLAADVLDDEGRLTA